VAPPDQRRLQDVFAARSAGIHFHSGNAAETLLSDVWTGSSGLSVTAPTSSTVAFFFAETWPGSTSGSPRRVTPSSAGKDDSQFRAVGEIGFVFGNNITPRKTVNPAV